MNQHFVNGIGVWADDDRFIKDVMINEEYKYLYDYDTVVDCGANVGTFSLWIYEKAKRIYAIEPNPDAMSLLKQTIAGNNLDKVILLEIALTGSDGKRRLANGEGPDYGSGLIDDKVGVEVECMQMDTFMATHQIDYIDLLKVDIEGGERELFSSAGFANASSKIGTIIGEYHTGEIEQHIGRVLEGLGYHYTDLSKAGSSGHFIARKK